MNQPESHLGAHFRPLENLDLDHAVGAARRLPPARHAEIENAIRDLKYGVGLNHLPSGKFGANGVWLAIQVLAHWTARLGLGAGILTTKTLRRRLFSVPGRLARSARHVTVHLPACWPWGTDFVTALSRLRALPLLV